MPLEKGEKKNGIMRQDWAMLEREEARGRGICKNRPFPVGEGRRSPPSGSGIIMSKMELILEERRESRVPPPRRKEETESGESVLIKRGKACQGVGR